MAATNQGLKAVHCLVHPERVNKAAFKTRLAEVLLPNPEPGSILVMDNWTIHKGDDIEKLVESHSGSIRYLPTCSPMSIRLRSYSAKPKRLSKNSGL